MNNKEDVIFDDNDKNHMKNEKNNLILYDYKVANDWIRNIWMVRITSLVTFILGSIYFIFKKTEYVDLLYFIPIISFFIDIALLLPTIPFVYISMFYEIKYFNKLIDIQHSPITNWHIFNKYFSISDLNDEMNSIDNLIVDRDKFKKIFVKKAIRYRISNFYSHFYIIILIFILLIKLNFIVFYI